MALRRSPGFSPIFPESAFSGSRPAESFTFPSERFELNSAFFVQPRSGSQVKLGNGYFLGLSLGQNPKRLADNGVIADFQNVFIVKDQDSGLLLLIFRLSSRFWRPYGIARLF